jgi:hypothetical protein
LREGAGRLEEGGRGDQCEHWKSGHGVVHRQRTVYWHTQYLRLIEYSAADDIRSRAQSD